MLPQYAYIKTRYQFGRQCLFEDHGPVVEENIVPDPNLTRNYMYRSYIHHGVQKSQQYAINEVQTVDKILKESGMRHLEGGWPKEVNPKDEEVTQRYRRRIEKDEGWATKMKHLTTLVERCILQNNTVNIYGDYFDDMVPTALTVPHSVRTVNVYADPAENTKPVSHLSWSPGNGDRLAASYSFLEFEVSPSDVNPDSYIWDIENPSKPLMTLKSISPSRTIEFNPRDPSMLIAGLMSGQVCNWDIRTGDRPVQISHRQHSHRNPANQALWIAAKTNTEFFSASGCGMIKWWDIRNLRNPTETLVMDLEDLSRADVNRAIGVSALQFEPTMGSRFMAGMENGVVVNANRKAATVTEKLATRIDCHLGAVVAIDRSPFSTKNFLTVGDWTAKIWADDTREGCLVSTCEQSAHLTGGCWSRSRYSVFFTASTKGLLEIYDILNGVHSPVATFRVCENALTAIAPREDGQLLAVGSHGGDIHLVECSGGLTINFKSDKARLASYLDMCSRYEKLVDGRLKEIRLRYSSREESLVRSVPSARDKTGIESKEKVKIRERDEDRIEAKKRSRSKRTGKDSAFYTDDFELAEVEKNYFLMVETEAEKYKSFDEQDKEYVTALIQESSVNKKKQKDIKTEEEAKSKEERKVRKTDRSRRALATSVVPEREQESSGEIDTDIEIVPAKSEGTIGKRRARSSRRACAVKACRPEICCMDMEGVSKAQKEAEGSGRKSHGLLSQGIPVSSRAHPSTGEKWHVKLSDLLDKIPKHSVGQNRRVLTSVVPLADDVLSLEVKQARKEVDAWRRRINYRKSTLQKSEKFRRDQKKQKGTEGIIVDVERRGDQGITGNARSNF